MKVTYEQKLVFLLIFSAVFFSVQLMTLESIKNVVLAVYLNNVVVGSPILNVNYNLRVMWDVALLGSFATYCLTVTCAYLLGREVNLNAKDQGRKI